MTLPRIENAGIDGWLVRLFDHIDESNMPWILALCERCEAGFGSALVDLVPSYTTVLVQYDPLQLDDEQARRRLATLLGQLTPDQDADCGELRQLPVWYDSSVGPELLRLERHTGWSRQQVIDAHCGREYRVFALGFAPGFAFMGSVTPELALPRLNTPRKRVPAGSVAVAERQTAAYPQATPGGWNLIGRTPARLFDRHRKQPSLLQVGDRVQFVAISRTDFERLGGDPSPIGAMEATQP